MGNEPGPPRSMTATARTALVHDWLTGFRGGEQVLLSLARLFPEALAAASPWRSRIKPLLFPFPVLAFC